MPVTSLNTNNFTVDAFARRVVFRTRGHRSGAITRLVSPSDLGQLLKPFVFLDLFDYEQSPQHDRGLHPHSGIGTITWVVKGSVGYEDTSGETGLIPEGGVEWMRAGAGVWHGGRPGPTGPLRGYQLWVALPPELENAPAQSLYIDPQSIEQVGPAKVLVGTYGGATSKIEPPTEMTYLAVGLKAGETWEFQPPKGQSVAWITVDSGSLFASEGVTAGELIVFEEREKTISVQAETDTQFLLGAAKKHGYSLALGSHSVHTNEDALRIGKAGIEAIRQRLLAQGRLS